MPDPERHGCDYLDGVRAWHSARARRSRPIRTELAPDGTVGFLVWGDPALYDSTIESSSRAPGSASTWTDRHPASEAFAARRAARIALNRIGQPVHIQPGAG